MKKEEEQYKYQKWSTECPKCHKRIKHFGNHETENCKKCKTSVDLFSPHNRHRKIIK